MKHLWTPLYMDVLIKLIKLSQVWNGQW
jgi:hypothetical protein